ncbi:MAG: hypothetical protein ACI4QS_10610 [Comamonas sp.]
MNEPQRHTPRASRWLSAKPPNFQDFAGPPDGDYVRYVEGLLAWSAQEQERQRLQARRSPVSSMATAALTDGQWGRAPGKEALSEPGRTAAPSPAWRSKLAAARALPLGVLMLGMVAAGVFAPALLPVLIIGWVVLNVIRAVRAASAQRPR